MVLLVAACTGTAQPGGAPSPTPTVSDSDPGGPTSTPGLGFGLLLSEVRFAPAPGDPQFVEITNAGADAVATSGLALDVGVTSLTLAAMEDSLAPSERLLFVFDGARPAESHTVHLEDADVVSDAGAVVLLDGADQALDRVAWEGGQAQSVSLAVGDFVPASVEPGTTIGRVPGADDAFQPTAWATYSPAQATPGAPNPVPAVEVLLPIDGAILTVSDATLDWYSVKGAASYRVQVAADTGFTALLVDTTVSEPQVSVGSLSPGHYVWHVQSIAADGTTSGVAGPSGFELRPTGEQVPRSDAGKQLNVPWLVQHKDTTMLLLEEPHEHAPMAWDMAHLPASKDDPADQKNCALAMVAMVNHFYGGDLSQDRIGYEELKARRPGDPEEDLMYWYGLDIEQTNAAFACALGGPVTFIPTFTSYDHAWTYITTEIDAGRPVAGAGPHHGYVISGYQVDRNGHRVMTVNDPARGQLPIDLDAGRGQPEDLSLWLMPEHPTARMQEKSVTADSDGDGVVDFDETQRFKTNPNDPDSDADKVRDKQDVVSGVFDPDNGYAFHPENSGRDWDGDALATELDPDSDAGGCQDGEEDKSGDGHRGDPETWNFDVTDDACHDLTGSITIDRTSTLDTGAASASRQTGLETLHATIAVSMQVDPNDPTALIDAGSTFTVDRTVTFERVVGGDCTPERSISKSNGTYRFLDPPVPSPGHTSDELGDDGGSMIWGVIDRQRGLMMISMVAWYPETIGGTCQLIELPGLPDVIDDWACGDKFLGFPGLGVDATIKDEPTGPDPVTIDCTFEGDVMNWDNQKLVAKGQLTLTAK